MRPETLRRCVAEAMKFVNMAANVPTSQINHKDRLPTEYIDGGKASGLVGAQSMILTRVLADLRQGR